MIHRISLVTILLLFAFACKNSKQPEQTSEKVAKVQNEKKEAQASENSSIEDVKMIRFEKGSFMMGNNNMGPREQPAHPVNVAAFYMDEHPVTVAQFRVFVKASAYVTEAERFKDSAVFDFKSGQWFLLPGTTWEFPLGPNEEKAKDDHPVTHVSWNDAAAYAKWAGKRLPSEAEWEYAARNGGTTDDLYPFGNNILLDGKWQANVYHGTIQTPETPDGYLYTAPAKSFAPSKQGLFGMTGNVWEWMNDTFVPYPGNNEPHQFNATVKSIRGGSFMYDEAGEVSYSVFFRSSNSAETSLFNTGFRCAKDGD